MALRCHKLCIQLLLDSGSSIISPPLQCVESVIGAGVRRYSIGQKFLRSFVRCGACPHLASCVVAVAVRTTPVVHVTGLLASDRLLF